MTSSPFLADLFEKGDIVQAFVIPGLLLQCNAIENEKFAIAQLSEEQMQLLENSNFWDEIEVEWSEEDESPTFCLFYANSPDMTDRMSLLPDLKNFFQAVSYFKDSQVMFPLELDMVLVAMSLALCYGISDPNDFILYGCVKNNNRLELKRNTRLMGRSIFNIKRDSIFGSEERLAFDYHFPIVQKAFSSSSQEATKTKMAAQIFLKSQSNEILYPSARCLLLISAISILEPKNEQFEQADLTREAYQRIRNNVAHGRTMEANKELAVLERLFISLLGMQLEILGKTLNAKPGTS